MENPNEIFKNTTPPKPEDETRRFPLSKPAEGPKPGSWETPCPMPKGEEMFNYHGYSGPCPNPPKERQPDVRPLVAEAERFFDSNKVYDAGNKRNRFARFAAAFHQFKVAAPSPAVAPPIEARTFIEKRIAAGLLPRLPDMAELIELLAAYYAACRSKEE